MLARQAQEDNERRREAEFASNEATDADGMVRSDLPGDGAMIRVGDRREHRAKFLRQLGLKVYRVAGQHSFRIPSHVKEVMVQVWGGGGGGGRAAGGRHGDGGGGGYVETILAVEPGDVLVCVVG